MPAKAAFIEPMLLLRTEKLRTRKDLLRYVTAGDPPQIKMEAPTKAVSGDFTLAELLGTLRSLQSGDPAA